MKKNREHKTAGLLLLLAAVTVSAADTRPASPAPSMPAASATAVEQRAEVLRAFETWLKAWNAKDVDTYLAAYAEDFEPPQRESRKAWEKRRRTQIWNKSYINVRAESPEVSVHQDRATVKFLQVYLSDRLREESRKTLLFERVRGKWLILQETSQR